MPWAWSGRRNGRCSDRTKELGLREGRVASRSRLDLAGLGAAERSQRGLAGGACISSADDRRASARFEASANHEVRGRYVARQATTARPDFESRAGLIPKGRTYANPVCGRAGFRSPGSPKSRSAHLYIRESECVRPRHPAIASNGFVIRKRPVGRHPRHPAAADPVFLTVEGPEFFPLRNYSRDRRGPSAPASLPRRSAGAMGP